MYMREICAYYVLQHQGVIGGHDLNVEIDEALFTKRKNNQGRLSPNSCASAEFAGKLRNVLWLLFLVEQKIRSCQ